jgi:outer membrane receptor for ferrienterochelin and colicin
MKKNTLTAFLCNAAIAVSFLTVGAVPAQAVPDTVEQPPPTPKPLADSQPAATTPETITLDAVVVSATGFKQHIIEAPASISVVSSADIQLRQITDIASALQGVEGVDIDARVGKTANQVISIRGMPSDYTLVLIDGRRQNAAADVTHDLA